LIKMGARDSKKMSDESVLTLSKKLKNSFPHKVLKLFPETYNKLYDKFHNLNRMLAWGHTTVLEELATKTSCKKAILDQFADKTLMQGFLERKKLDIDLTQRFKGEEDPVVAAASILARGAFLEGLAELEDKFQVKLPKGASSAVITAAKKAIERHGNEILPLVSKTHFKTTLAVLNGNNDA
jgi:ribonuclease HIII